MNRYASIIFSAFFLLTAFLACQVLAANIREKQASIGYGCRAQGEYSTAMGYGTRAEGYASTAMGIDTEAEGYASTAMGDDTRAEGYWSTAMGNYTRADSAYETVIGRYNTLYSPASTSVWEPTDRLFVIGNGISSARSDAMVVLKNGNVGIGTTGPRELLEVAGDGRAFFGNGGGSSRTGLLIDGNEGAPYARLEAYNYGTGTGMDLVMNTVGNGNVGIGTTSPGKKLYVNGSAGGTQAWNASDKREKTDIEPIRYALDNVSKLRGVAYRWKRGDEKESQGLDNKAHFGVIAQEIEAVYPELVDNPGVTEKRKHVEYNGLVGVLIEAVKELKEMNDDQKARIEAQQAQIEKLSTMIKNLNI